MSLMMNLRSDLTSLTSVQGAVKEPSFSEAGDEDILGMIATVLIVVLHVTTSCIHIVLVAAVVLLILHFFTGSGATV
jgi:hypothetical protein